MTEAKTVADVMWLGPMEKAVVWHGIGVDDWPSEVVGFKTNSHSDEFNAGLNGGD